MKVQRGAGEQKLWWMMGPVTLQPEKMPGYEHEQAKETSCAKLQREIQHAM